MGDADKHIARVEAALEKLRENPDQVIHELYLIIILHDGPPLDGMTGEQRQGVRQAVSAACLNILCPPLAVSEVDDEICFLVQINPDRSADDVARTAAAAVARQVPNAPPWNEEYSVLSVSADSADELTDAFEIGGSRLHEALEGLMGDDSDEDEFEGEV